MWLQRLPMLGQDSPLIRIHAACLALPMHPVQSIKERRAENYSSCLAAFYMHPSPIAHFLVLRRFPEGGIFVWGTQ